MIQKPDKNKLRKARHLRTRKNITGTATRPRFCVYRSSGHIYAQLIDDANGQTVASASSLEADIKKQCEDVSKVEAAKIVGKKAAEKALAAGIVKAVFDRGGYLYTGRVAAVAQGAREAGLDF